MIGFCGGGRRRMGEMVLLYCEKYDWFTRGGVVGLEPGGKRRSWVARSGRIVDPVSKSS